MAFPGDPLEDSLLALWDTDGSTVLEQSSDKEGTDLSKIAWVAARRGTYYLTVESGPDGFAKEGYRLVVRQGSR